MSLTAAAIGLGAAGVAGNLIGSALNYKAQQDNLAWQKNTQRDIFAREDTSIARRVADLEASGLSPVLAAGQGAGTGGVVSTNAPQLDLPDTSMLAINMLKQEADISATRAQEAYTELQRKNAETLLPAQLASMEAQIKNTDAQTYKTYQDAKTSKVAAKNAEDSGFIPKTTIGGWLYDAVNAGVSAAEKTKQIKKAQGKPVKNNPLPKKKSPTIDFNKIVEENKKAKSQYDY